MGVIYDDACIYGMRRGQESKRTLIMPRLSPSASSTQSVPEGEEKAADNNGSETCGPVNTLLYSRMLTILNSYN